MTEKSCSNCFYNRDNVCVNTSINSCTDLRLWKPKEPEKSCVTCKHHALPGLCEPCINCLDFKLHESKEPETSIKRPAATPETQKRGKVLKKAFDIINGERQDSYGNPEDSFGLIAGYWSEYLNSKFPSSDGFIDIDPREVAEMMILFKVARMSGQKPTIDTYADCAGYAGIAGDMVE
jgi:hypothetical protein